MARPQKDGVDYFPHDTNASTDVKLEPILYLYGAEGYAFYFLHLEYIYRESEFKLDISDAETVQILCRKLQITEQKYREILNSSLKRGLFSQEIYEKEGCLTSEGVQKRAGRVLEKRRKMAAKYTKNETKTVFDPVSVSKPGTETMSETRQSKVKESKVNISANADINNTSNTPNGVLSPSLGGTRKKRAFSKPTLEEVEAYCEERGNGIDAHRFVDYYESKGWLVGKTPMKDWKAAVRTWEAKSGAGKVRRREYEEF